MSRNRVPDKPIGRRDFARTIAGGLGAAWLGRSVPLLAQSPADAAPDYERVGVTPTEVVFGSSSPFKGAIASLGADYFRGATALFSEINAQGGIAGRTLKLVALDDGYSPVQTLKNTIRLIDEEKVFALFNYVGTPTLTRTLPVIRQYRDRGIVLIGNLSGAQPQREEPYSDQIFNVRASYRRESGALVDELWKQGMRKFGVFYQIDAFGRSGWDGFVRGLARYGASIAAESTYRRGATFASDMGSAMAQLRRAGVDVVLMAAVYQPAAGFVKAARVAGWGVPIANISPVGAETMLELLSEEGKKTARDFTTHLVSAQIMPSYEDPGLPGVREYRELMDRWNPPIPPALTDPDYKPLKYSYNGLEGFVNAKILVEGLRRAGSDLTRSRFKLALESISEYDPGIGATVSFSRTRHQGLDRVYFTTVSGGRWIPITDWRQALVA